jgi:hypothetical protein
MCSRFGTSTAALALLLAACTSDPSTPTTPEGATRVGASTAAAVGGGNPAIIETGTFTHTFGLAVRDFDNHLLLYYRWNDGFPCRGIGATTQEETTYHDVVKLDEWWIVQDKDPEMWFYVFPWNGEPFNCAFLANTQFLASGRGTRLIHDNDYYPFDPYAPGPNANAYLERYGGLLTTPAGTQVAFSGETNATADRDGNIIHWLTALRLSPDPRN